MIISRVAVFILVVAFVKSAYANDDNDLGLVNYEPNLVGYTYDNDDKEGFLDFKISLQYPIWTPDFLDDLCPEKWLRSCQPFFSFTGRFGQYISVRDSSPVIGKRFNPKLFMRFKRDNDNYLDLEYAHESNGQRISSAESYNQLATELASTPNGEAYHANDYISRGWDYIGFTYKYSRSLTDSPIADNVKLPKMSLYLTYSNYIGGKLQNEIEEYFDWEPRREITSRKQVSGWRFLGKIENKNKPLFLFINKFALIYETGTRDTFDNNTFKLELTTRQTGVPIMLWVKTGYNSDLAQYYKDVTSYGLSFELKTLE